MEEDQKYDPEICLEDDMSKNYLRPSSIIAYTMCTLAEPKKCGLQIIFSDGTDSVELQTKNENLAESWSTKIHGYMRSVPAAEDFLPFVCIEDGTHNNYIDQNSIRSYCIQKFEEGILASGVLEYALDIRLKRTPIREQTDEDCVFLTTRNGKLVGEWSNKLSGKTRSELKVEKMGTMRYAPVFCFKATLGELDTSHYVRRGNIRRCEIKRHVRRESTDYSISIYLTTGEKLKLATEQADVANEWIKHLGGNPFFLIAD